MRKSGIIMTVLASLVLTLNIVCAIRSNYQYEDEIYSYWSLADKSSTIAQKAKYIDQFVLALEKNVKPGEYDAIFLKTPNNSFDANLQALKTLQSRLHEIEKMDVTSFQYQTAIQQITQQEQGEAGEMLGVFHGVWYKTNYIFIWDWIGWVQNICFVLILIVGICFWNEEFFNN